MNFDCLNLITNDLCYIDIFSLKYSCKSLSLLKFTLPNFKDILIRKLLECNVVPTKEDALKFCDNLYDTGAYVAGNFILDCLYDANYHNDIDIYDQTSLDPKSVTNNNICWFHDFGSKNLKFTQSLYHLGFKSIGKLSETDLKLRSFIYVNREPDTYLSNIHPWKIIFPTSIKHQKNLIQIIPIDLKLRDDEKSVIPRFIKSSFDLDICQNYFDGKFLYVRNVHKLIHKYDFIKPNTKFMLQVYDIGDNDDSKRIRIDSNDQDDYENMNTKDRINKYINRGFDIKYHPKYDEIKLYIRETLENNKYCKFYDCPNFNNCSNKDHERDNIRCIDNGLINLDIY